MRNKIRLSRNKFYCTKGSTYDRKLIRETGHLTKVEKSLSLKDLYYRVRSSKRQNIYPNIYTGDPNWQNLPFSKEIRKGSQLLNILENPLQYCLLILKFKKIIHHLFQTEYTSQILFAVETERYKKPHWKTDCWSVQFLKLLRLKTRLTAPLPLLKMTSGSAHLGNMNEMWRF